LTTTWLDAGIPDGSIGLHDVAARLVRRGGWVSVGVMGQMRRIGSRHQNPLPSINDTSATGSNVRKGRSCSAKTEFREYPAYSWRKTNTVNTSVSTCYVINS
jgi:hypothetical protein